MWQLNEDDYWERRRERLEAPRRGCDDPPECGEELLGIDDIADDLEERYGSLEAIAEDDLLDIVKSETGIDAASARFDRQFFCIAYTAA